MIYPARVYAQLKQIEDASEGALAEKKHALGVRRFGPPEVRALMLEARLFGEKKRDESANPPHVVADRLANEFFARSKMVMKVPQGELPKIRDEVRAGYLGVGSRVTEDDFPRTKLLKQHTAKRS